MGVVYLAHDPKIDRRVAIKTIHMADSIPALEAEEMRDRFTREARAAGKLQHPGIVTIFDVGEHESSYFIAMEYIEGSTLETHTVPGALLPTDHVLDLVAQACDALNYAHQQHVVHRDIKPANLMVVKGGGLKITDFGLAKNPSTNMTQEGILMGTPNYMAPEQILGQPLDGRADLFSLGAVLYEMLTGQRPFSGDSITTIIYRIVHEPPKEPRDLKVGIPPALSRVVLKALEKDPERRFQTGDEFGRALRARATKVAVAGIGGRDAIATARMGARGLPQPYTAPAAVRPAVAQAPS
ncbi:MAG TPA: serine/threonine-protein kinase, partial [Candidatus Polarisedimenticolia bacterium]|nr:serine/threonine-protein kinase [Candidatus Polarisedimenticolia bacterium]